VAPVLAALMVAVAADAIWVPPMASEAMRRTPAHLLARTRAAILFVTRGTLPVTSLLGGAVAQAIGAQPTLLFAAGTFTACAVGVWRRRISVTQ
jgi:hypothetical protein